MSNNYLFISKSKILDLIWLTVIFLFSINLLNKTNYIFLALLFVGLLIVDYRKLRFKFTLDFIILSLFSLSYYIIFINYNETGINTMLFYLIGPVAAFFIGYFIVERESNFILKTFLVIILGNFLYGSLNMITYFNTFGFNSVERYVPDFWSGHEIGATLQGTYFTLVSSLLFFSFLLIKKRNKKVLSITIFFGTIFSIYSSLILGNRTLILVTVLVFGVNIIVFLILNKSNTLRNLKIFIFLMLFILILFVIYSNNIIGIRDFILNSQLNNRLDEGVSLADDPRLIAYNKAISQILTYPFGGYQMDIGGVSYVHNLWLDVSYATGIIPFFLLLLFSIKSILNLMYIIKNNSEDILFKVFVISIFLGYLLNFMVEPILEGVPYMFLSFCLLAGMLRKHSDELRLKS
ncbi:MAG: hypothetical protein ACQEUD_20050 [Bacillota bacterium]